MEKKTYSLDDNTIDVYLQKSAMFLFPLLKISAKNKIQQLQSYLAWQGEVEIFEYKLICIYDLIDDLEYAVFKKNTLLKNKYFNNYFEGADKKGIYIFNLESFKADVDIVLKGKYSLLSTEVKKIIMEFYCTNKYSRAYVDSYINPENYFSKYAALLNVEEWRLRSVGELADPLNRVKETLIMEKASNIAIAA